MTKFDFKKWVIEHKHGKKSLDEQRGRGDAIPRMAPCDSGPFGPLGCETFLECGTSTNKAYHFIGGPASYTNTLFHSFVGSPSVGQVVELQKNDGTILKLTYQGIIPGTGTLNLGNSNDWVYVGLSTCVVSVMGCMDPGANNFNSSVTQDDGSCAYGYDCGQLFNPPKYGLTKCNKNMQAGTNGTFQTLQSCVASGCEPIPADTGKFELPTNKLQDEPMDVEPTEY